MLLRQFPNIHIYCIKCNSHARSARPLITCVPLIILSSEQYGLFFSVACLTREGDLIALSGISP